VDRADFIGLFSVAAVFWGGSTLRWSQALIHNPDPNATKQASLIRLRQFKYVKLAVGPSLVVRVYFILMNSLSL